jgi:hypothetical protein
VGQQQVALQFGELGVVDPGLGEATETRVDTIGRGAAGDRLADHRAGSRHRVAGRRVDDGRHRILIGRAQVGQGQRSRIDGEIGHGLNPLNR